MDEDKPRERDTQLSGLGSAKRIFTQAVCLGGATHVRLRAVGDFFVRRSPVSH